MTTATDIADSNLDITYADSVTTISPNVFTITRTWTVTDDSGAVVSTDDDPHGNNTEGNGITGTSGGEYFVDDPTYVHYNVTVPAGATDLRWRYSTDAAYLDTGWFIDDVTVNGAAAAVAGEGDKPWVVTDWAYLSGPPFVSVWGSSTLSASTICFTTPRSEPKTNFMRIGWSCDGIFSARRDFSKIFHSAFSGMRTQPTTRSPIARPQGNPSDSRASGVSQSSTVSDSDDGPSRSVRVSWPDSSPARSRTSHFPIV